MKDDILLLGDVASDVHSVLFDYEQLARKPTRDTQLMQGHMGAQRECADSSPDKWWRCMGIQSLQLTTGGLKQIARGLGPVKTNLLSRRMKSNISNES